MNEVIELQRKVDDLANVEGKVDKVMDNVVSVHVSVDEMIKAEKELVNEVIRMEKEVIGNSLSVQNTENVLKVQLQQDKQEEMEKEKRKLNLVMHGVVQYTSTESEQRVADDCDRVQELLHIIREESVEY